MNSRIRKSLLKKKSLRIRQNQEDNGAEGVCGDIGGKYNNTIKNFTKL